jgi:hypothetical protein
MYLRFEWMIVWRLIQDQKQQQCNNIVRKASEREKKREMDVFSLFTCFGGEVPRISTLVCSNLLLGGYFWLKNSIVNNYLGTGSYNSTST